MGTTPERFSIRVLEDRIFKVDWTATETRLKEAKGKNGGVYEREEKYLHVRIKGYADQDFLVGPVQARDYEMLRMLYLSGIKAFSCTLGLPKTEGDFAPRIFAGAEMF